jgi:biotin carboxyl carrier protein
MEGERAMLAERMIIAPTAGTFRPSEFEEGHEVELGSIVGYVDGPGSSTEVVSPFKGRVQGYLAHEGERLRTGEHIAWLRVS